MANWIWPLAALVLSAALGLAAVNASEGVRERGIVIASDEAVAKAADDALVRVDGWSAFLRGEVQRIVDRTEDQQEEFFVSIQAMVADVMDLVKVNTWASWVALAAVVLYVIDKVWDNVMLRRWRQAQAARDERIITVLERMQASHELEHHEEARA